MLNKFNELLGELRKPNGLNGPDSDLHSLSTNFEDLLIPWIQLFQCEDLTGPFVHNGICSIRTFLHSGMFTDSASPFSRSFLQDLIFSLAHSRFEPTNLETDEIVMLELIEFLSEFLQVTIASIKSTNYSSTSISNEELIGETFVFQLFDLLFVLMNQTRFSELLRAKAVEIAVEQCSLLFSSIKKISQVATGGRITTINFPNIVKPEKPSTPIIQKASLTENNSDSVVNVNIKNFEAVISDIPAVLTNGAGEREMHELNESVQGELELTECSLKKAPYNPFTDENEQDLAPDAIAEVMKFRAKIAGITLDSSSSSFSSSSSSSFAGAVDLFADRLSSHAHKEVLLQHPLYQQK